MFSSNLWYDIVTIRILNQSILFRHNIEGVFWGAAYLIIYFRAQLLARLKFPITVWPSLPQRWIGQKLKIRILMMGHQLSQFSCIHHSPLQSWKLSHTSKQFAQHGASKSSSVVFDYLKKTWIHFWLLRLYISNLCICYAPIAKVLQSQQMKIRRNVICWRGKGLSWNRTL